ncbi:hypothetical protein [Aquihabitans sp. McL0605]|uniref:hypothetical protein n=1 Tax=Aquihabitans sp. McL0605 TaxID=3415671 RepID=UPI003CEF8D3C
MTRRTISVTVVAGISLLLLLTGCAGVRSERQGKDVGKAICDLRDVDNKDDAQKQIAKINEDLKDARRITGVDVNQDLRAIDQQLSDLAEHAAQGNGNLTQQDLAVIRRNLDQAISSTSDNVQRYYQGVREGLDTCYDN